MMEVLGGFGSVLDLRILVFWWIFRVIRELFRGWGLFLGFLARSFRCL